MVTWFSKKCLNNGEKKLLYEKNYQLSFNQKDKPSRYLSFMQFNACKYNKVCDALYERIVAKGKSKKLAVIAVCNMLLKQAFAISKSGLIDKDTYRSVL